MSRQIDSPQTYTYTSESVLELILSKLRLTLTLFILRDFQLRPEGRNRRGETRLRGPEVLGPFRGLGIRPLVSVIRGLGSPFPEAP